MLIRKSDEREKAEWDERVRFIYSIVFIPEYHSTSSGLQYAVTQ
jgi:hypothetical protein